MPITINIEEAHDLLAHTLRAELVPLLVGSPGMGKSDLVKQIANEFELELIDLRLAQCDPTDLLGFPDIDRNANKARYVPMDTFPIEGDEVPENKFGWLLFLDEFTSADRSVQKAAYKLILDRMVGTHKLHANVRIVCAGNTLDDGAIVEELSTALQSRLVHYKLETDVSAWMKWATTNNVDHHITSFINFKPALLNNFDPEHTDCTFACQRTWQFADKLIKAMGINHPFLLTALAGTLSEGVAREFVAFSQIYNQLPDIPTIIAGPGIAPVPTEASILFALSGALASRANDTSLENIVKYVSRLPVEFSVVTLREVWQRKPELRQAKPLLDWALKMGKEFG